MQKRQKINWDKNLNVKICFSEEKKKISEISKFSILSYTQNRKLENLGKCSFTSNVDSCYNLRFRSNKNEVRQKLKVTKWIKKKKENFRGFRVFDFVQYPKLKTRKSQKVSLYFKFLQRLWRIIFCDF